jgi:uncharacterized protein involved in exopolysaccharide biosynthesis
MNVSNSSRISVSEDVSGLVTRPRLSLADLAVQLWRAKWLMLLVFLPLFALGLVAALSMDEKYTAQSRLMVSLGDEYVYRPAVGSEGPSIAPELEALVQSELELIRSPVISEQVVSKFDLKTLYPDLKRDCDAKRARVAGNPDAIREAEALCQQLAIEALRKDFGAGSSPKTPVITATFTHKDRTIATEMLNAIIGSYLSYRSQIFSGSNSSGLAQQREQFELDLIGSEEAIRTFLVSNNLGSFEGERATVDQLYQTASRELLSAQARLRQVKAQLSAYEMQISTIPVEQDIYVEDTAEQTVSELKLEREEKLTRYKPDSRAIQDLDKRIAQAEAFVANRSRPAGTVRRGPNPLYAQIESAINTLRSEADALTAQQAELAAQIASFAARQQRLIKLEPEYQELLRRRDLYANNVEGYAEREIEARTRSELVQQNVDNIRVLEKAAAPAEGSSLKFPVAVLALLFAGFTALMAGLLKALTQQGFATSRSIERTLGVPVVADVREQ